MNPQDSTIGVAVVCNRSDESAAAVETYLHATGSGPARWFAPRDVDEVDAALRSGAVRRIIFPRLANFLEALWNEPLTLDVWLAPDTRVELAETAGPDDPARLRALVAAWQQTSRRQRRARAIAGFVLSVVALAAAFVLLAVTR